MDTLIPTSEVLCEYSQHPLDAAQYGPVDHHGVFLLALLVHEVQVEPERQLEVELDGGALVLPLEGVLQRDVDLGAVEGSVPLVQLPLEAGCVERLLEPLLGRVPHLDLLQELLRTAAAGR